ncbi:MAG TPA: VOC family protein, partial [Bacteroidota bacterium]|nr:VOC family protein [Bacteroidota bacterium]
MDDFLPINGTDYVELYVGNARQSTHFYRSAFGFSLVAYAGPETGMRDRASYVLQQDKIRLVLTTPLQGDGPIAAHVARHGDGVHDIALWVDDARSAYRETTARGAQGILPPEVLKDDTGEVVRSSIAAYGD